MDNQSTYDTLWQVTQKEKQSNELQLLPKPFYNDVDQFLKSLGGHELTDNEQNIKKNTIRLLNELQERRKQKILIYVAYKKQLPQPAIQTEVDFYNKILDIANQNSIETGAQQKQHVHMLKSLQSIPEILLPSGKKLGPLEKGQLIEMSGNEEDVKFLINSTICQQA